MYIDGARCMRCGRPIKRETEEYCMDCSRSDSDIDQGKNLWLHREPVSGALYRFKYKNKRSWGRVFAEELAAQYTDQIRKWKIDAVVPVPLHSSRLRKRGFNQAEILAQELSALTGLPVYRDVLYRIRKTTPQKKLGRGSRMKNLKGAFGVSRSWVPCRNVLLIDDIYTTGATLDSAARVLKIAGVQNVYFLTVSIGQGV